MKRVVAVRLLRLLNGRPEDALTAKQIAAKWAAAYSNDPDLRTFQRWMSELSSDNSDGPAVVDVIYDEKAPRYSCLQFLQGCSTPEYPHVR